MWGECGLDVGCIWVGSGVNVVWVCAEPHPQSQSQSQSRSQSHIALTSLMLLLLSLFSLLSGCWDPMESWSRSRSWSWSWSWSWVVIAIATVTATAGCIWVGSEVNVGWISVGSDGFAVAPLRLPFGYPIPILPIFVLKTHWDLFSHYDLDTMHAQLVQHQAIEHALQT